MGKIIGCIYHDYYCNNKGRGLSTVSANKSQTSGRNNGRIPIGRSPLWPDFCGLFDDTVLKPCPLLLL